MKLDFLIPGTSNAAFCSQIAFFKLGLKALGGSYADARVVAVFGDHETESLPEEWRRHFDDIEVEWAHPIGATNEVHRAQNDRRYDVMRRDADLVFMCDADVAVMRPFDELIDQLIAKPAVAGVIAHDHFPWPGREATPEVDWPELAQKTIGKAIETPFRYSLLPHDAPKNVPFYINYGVFVGPLDMMRDFNLRDQQLRDLVASELGHHWAPQVSMALTCADLGLATSALPIRYNFPNDEIADELYPEELKKIVFMHYLRLGVFRRDMIFLHKNYFQDFLGKTYQGSNEVFRAFVQKVTQNSYPFGSG